VVSRGFTMRLTESITAARLASLCATPFTGVDAVLVIPVATSVVVLVAVVVAGLVGVSRITQVTAGSRDSGDVSVSRSSTVAFGWEISAETGFVTSAGRWSGAGCVSKIRQQ